jgi:hypothetical protein
MNVTTASRQCRPCLNRRFRGCETVEVMCTGRRGWMPQRRREYFLLPFVIWLYSLLIFIVSTYNLVTSLRLSSKGSNDDDNIGELVFPSGVLASSLILVSCPPLSTQTLANSYRVYLACFWWHIKQSHSEYPDTIIPVWSSCCILWC